MIAGIIDIFLGALSIYLMMGLIFSIYFYAKAGSKIDEGTKGTPWHFKLIIFPGVVLLWVALLAKHLKTDD